jgi:AcrR family transcriptional regulator
MAPTPDGPTGAGADAPITSIDSPAELSGWLPGVVVGLTEEPHQARSRKTARQVIDAAEELLAAEGAENLTMAAVSKRAGVSIGAIYGRFDGKSGLLRAVKDRALHQLEAELADRYESPCNGVEGVVRELVEAIQPPTRRRLLQLSPETEIEPPGQREILARQRLTFMFKDAAKGHLRQIAHPNPSIALEVAFRLVIAGLASYDEMTNSSANEPLSLDLLGSEIIKAVTSYLCGAGVTP